MTYVLPVDEGLKFGIQTHKAKVLRLSVDGAGAVQLLAHGGVQFFRVPYVAYCHSDNES